MVLLLPLYFVYSGLNPRSACSTPVAVAGHARVLRRTCRQGRRLLGGGKVHRGLEPEALGIATLMNARGMMELILLNIGLQRGITPTLFTMLVLMTIATTLMATRCSAFSAPRRLRGDRRRRPVAHGAMKH